MYFSKAQSVFLSLCFWKDHAIIYYWLLIDNHLLLCPYVPPFFHFIGHKTCHKQFHTLKYVLFWNVYIVLDVRVCIMRFYYNLISNINKCRSYHHCVSFLDVKRLLHNFTCFTKHLFQISSMGHKQTHFEMHYYFTPNCF